MRQKTLSRCTGLLLAGFLAFTSLTGCSSWPAESSANEYEQFSASDAAEIQVQFDKMTDQLFREEVVSSVIDLHYTLSDPEKYGIDTYEATFGDFSLDHMKENYQDMRELQAELKAFSRDKLREDQQLTYDILESYVETELGSEGLELYYQPLSPTIGIQAQLPILLCEYAFYRKQDVEDYLSLLGELDQYYSQILAFEQEKADAGLFMNEQALNEVLDSCESYTVLPENNFMTETFQERLAELGDVTEEEKAAYLSRHETVLREQFIPAYAGLMEGLESLRPRCTAAKGLCSQPEGKKYYEYLLASSVATSYDSVDALSSAIISQMAEDNGQMAKIISENPNLISEIDTYEFKLTEPAEILEDLKKQMAADFPELPSRNYTVKYVPKALENSLSPAFYLTPPLDLPDHNVIYINGNDKYDSSDLYTILAHEGYPGHLYQNVYFNENSSCDLRSILSFSSYSEGWASYVERYAYSLDNGLSPALGELLAYNSSASLALHAFLDIAINYHGWSKMQTADYLRDTFGIVDQEVVDNFYHAMIANPTNYLEYYVGYLEIMNMRRTAEKKLGSRFNLKEFHKFLLDIGPAPFEVIQSHFQVWMATAGT